MSMFFKGPKDSVLLPLKAVFLTTTGSEFEVAFKGRFRRPNPDERQEIDASTDRGINDWVEVITQLMIGWEGVQDQENAPIEFNPENLAACLREREYLEACVKGVLTVLYGKRAVQEVERGKNSRRPAATG